MQILILRMLNLANRALDYILLMLILLIGSLGIYFLWDASNSYSQADSDIYKQYKPSAEEDSNFNELMERNPDVIAWLTVDNTGIDYPVVRGENNTYYLTRDVEGNISSSGSIFLDSGCDGQFNDFNTIIYGHHMAYGSMFGNLDKYSDENFFNEHLSGRLYFNGIVHRLEFFAFLDRADGYDSRIYSCKIIGEEERKSYIEYLRKQSRFYHDIAVSENDRIVLLSTCSHTMTNGRYILVGKIGESIQISDKEDADVGTTQECESENFFRVVPLFVWILVILLSILLIVILLIMKRRKKRR